MQIITQTLENFIPGYPIEKLAPADQILFIDIETTGFTAKTSFLYLIGCAFYKDNSWQLIQWFAENYTEEKDILTAFFTLAADYPYLVHFNGNNFDLPFLLQKCIQFELPYDFSHMEGIDLYRRVSPFKFFLKLENCKQKTIEQFLGIKREDTFSGGELISLYHDYVKEPDETTAGLLLLHNAEDIQGMMQCLPILAYGDLLCTPLKVKKVQANSYRNINGEKCKELYMYVVPPVALPVPISYTSNDCYFKGEQDLITLKVPLIEAEMKYFYANYKDYYYLPAEDVALHKSVASFVEKEHRQQATAHNCYTRKQSEYLPQWDRLFSPLFTKDYDSKEYYFELTDEMKKDRQAFNQYAQHVLCMMVENY
ncbi:MAG: ribonuclease H-like domain-containing protein [Lachnospiraceae bacterium]|nr:ribonuclease H-like domain-containing protein [Lachnospiraceae bacterium]